jgi:hypothetical protein
LLCDIAYILVQVLVLLVILLVGIVQSFVRIASLAVGFFVLQRVNLFARDVILGQVLILQLLLVVLQNKLAVDVRMLLLVAIIVTLTLAA